MFEKDKNNGFAWILYLDQYKLGTMTLGSDWIFYTFISTK